jgi:DNA-binding CsgD family transcriptional regulator
MKAATSNAVSFTRVAAPTPGTACTLRPESDAIARDRRVAPPAHLTPRQLEVLALLSEGLPNKLICRQLNIAAGTVKVHISCILRELGVTSRLQAVVAAGRHGLLWAFPVRIPAETWSVAPAGGVAVAAGVPRCKVSRLDPVAF